MLLAPIVLILTATPAWASPAVTVQITADVTDSAIACTLPISASVSGQSSSSLSGAGIDGSQCIGAPSFPPAECVWALTGSVAGSVVTLTGTVVQSSDHNGEVGTPVMLTANGSTGTVVWTFGGLTFTGTGTVAIG
jgi:hypothetical protein